MSRVQNFETSGWNKSVIWCNFKIDINVSKERRVNIVMLYKLKKIKLSSITTNYIRQNWEAQIACEEDLPTVYFLQHMVHGNFLYFRALARVIIVHVLCFIINGIRLSIVGSKLSITVFSFHRHPIKWLCLFL